MPGLTLRGCLFALPTLGLPMGGFDGSQWDGDDEDNKVNWPTPSAAASVQGQNNPDGRRGQTLVGATRAQPWPTPSASNPNDGEPFESWDARRQALQARHQNGNGVGMPLGVAVRQPWPTPTVTSLNNRKGISEKAGDGLGTAVAAWPTATAMLASRSSVQAQADYVTRTGHQMNLKAAVGMSAWPTPRAQDGRHCGCSSTPCTESRLAEGKANLPEAVLETGRAWATPKARDHKSGCTDPEAIQALMDRRVMGSNDLTNQVAAVAVWPTPRAGSATGGGTGLDGGSGSRAMLAAALPEAEAKAMVTGLLNPEWVELLMGWELGWTDAAHPCPGIWPGWPAGMGPDQHHYEPPRLLPKGHGLKTRTARLKACGNGVVPQQATAAFFLILTFGPGGPDLRKAFA